MKLFVVGLPHTEVTKEYSVCAFTIKVLNFCKMMTSLGHEVVLLAGGDQADTDCSEFISCISKSEQQIFWGFNDWKKDFFAVEFSPELPYWKLFNERAIAEIGKRIQPKDFICIIGGTAHKPIADAFPDNMTVEFGIGYEGSFAKYRVFESYAWMHYTYGRQGIIDGQAFDCVIPNYYDPEDFPFVASPDENYFAFIGRLIERKGAIVAVDATKRLNAKLKIAGQGVKSVEPGRIIGSQVTLEGDHLEYVGTVNFEERAVLVGNAKALFVPTLYIEPFGGVVVEAMLYGTPVIASDWGAFPELIKHGFNGFRFRTLAEATQGAFLSDVLDRRQIRDYAIANYSMEVIKHKYQAYFEQLLELWDKGWFTEKISEDYLHRYC